MPSGHAGYSHKLYNFSYCNKRERERKIFELGWLNVFGEVQRETDIRNRLVKCIRRGTERERDLGRKDESKGKREREKKREKIDRASEREEIKGARENGRIKER